MLYIAPHLWVITLLCSIGAATTRSPIYSNTTFISSLSRISATPSRVVVVSGWSSAISSYQPSKNGTTTVLVPSPSSFRLALSASSQLSSLSSLRAGSASVTMSYTTPSQLVLPSLQSLSTSAESITLSKNTSETTQISTISPSDVAPLSSQNPVSAGVSASPQPPTISYPVTRSASLTTSSAQSPPPFVQSSPTSAKWTTSTITTDRTSQISTILPFDITSLSTLVIDWSTITPTTTTGVTKATHNPDGWPIIPGVHCWFCPQNKETSSIGFVFPGIRGPGILPPPLPGEVPPSGFSSDMPPITAGDPSYDSTEPTGQLSNSASTTSAKSSSSSCTRTTTGYDLYITCTSATGLPVSASCQTSTVTTTGCDIETTASTSTLDTCSLSVLASISAEYLSEAAAVGTVVSETTYPLALWPTEVSVSFALNFSTSAGLFDSLTYSTSSAPPTLLTSSSGSLPFRTPEVAPTLTTATSHTTSSEALTYTAFSVPSMLLTSSSGILASSTAIITPTSTSVTSLMTAPPLVCSERNNKLMGVDNTPASWCFCGRRGPFSTISGSTTSYCAFSVLPNQTITLTSHSTSIYTGCVVTTTMYTPRPSANPTPDVYCQCGNVQAGIGTTTVNSNVVVGCELPTWVILSTISTIAPKTTSTTTSKPAYQTGVCNVHITEASNDYDEPLHVQLNISDGGGSLLTSQNFKIDWGESVSIPATDSKLAYAIDVGFLTKPPALPLSSDIDWEDWIVTLSAGSTSWNNTEAESSALPYCNVGAWDNNNFWEYFGLAPSHTPNRQMDCHWNC